MKKCIYQFLFSLFALLFSSSLLADVTIGSSLASLPKDKDLLFVMLSKQGAIKIINEKTQTYGLTLKGVNPDVIYFADRPSRLSGHVNLVDFISLWNKKAFRDNPPNAVMQAIRLNALTHLPSKTVSYAIVLQNPVYDANKKELHFTISPLPGNQLALPKLARSDYVAIFIDDYCIICIH